MVSVIHAVCCTIMAIKGAYYFCDDSKSVFENPECASNPRKWDQFTLLFSLGYFIEDTLYMRIMMQDTSALGF